MEMMHMIRRSTIQLLRFHFSFFLMPVYWFALSQVVAFDVKGAWLCGIILHLLVYPASNGYNSFMDRDESSIGGIKKPLMPTRQLYIVTIVLDLLAILLSFLISACFAIGVTAFILASKAYSYRGIRLKRYPVWGYLTVIIFQGALVYWLTHHAASLGHPLQVSWIPMLASALLVGGFYPLTQIYQHEADRKDGVRTLSMLLGYRGSFIFTGVIFFMAMLVLAWHLGNNLELDRFFLVQIWMLPVIVYFLWWFRKVWKNPNQANFTNTMRMNILASACTNAAFIHLFLIDRF